MKPPSNLVSRTAFRAMLIVMLAIALYSCDKPTLGPDSTGSIKGTVRDYDTNKTLSNVNITTSPPTSSLVTDSNGNFTINNIASGNYSINASKYGYTGNSVTVNVNYGQNTEAVIFMKPSSGSSSSGSNYPLSVDIINWTNRTVTADSIYVDVQYKVSNIGTSDLSKYNIYFKILTTSKNYEYEETGSTLSTNQSNINNFSEYIYNHKADSVYVDGTWSN